ncbi:MAG: 4-demethylwyosine synthase TYW1 [Candidatus Micrarchaeota archaeon]|nr:4-demethylwyosine synthase TYW1 [Candidatus Micrarchaeota archaeon]
MARERSAKGRGKHYAKLKKAAPALPEEMLKLLIRQKYHLAGQHSAAKLCHWSHSALKGGESCYKSRFYGIASHRCLQCTPVLLFCNHACVFCWRFMPEKDKYGSIGKKFAWDEPEKIAEWLISAQKELVSGYGGNKKVRKELYEQACEPKHVALSLTGEPAMYPYIGRLLREFHRRGMTTFLVTNGTFPERMEKWEEMPTQLYVSMVAPNEDAYLKSIRPAERNLWKKYLKGLEVLRKLGEKTRTVLRMTLCRGVNDFGLEGYARQIAIAKPHYVEVKSMVFVGGARQPGRNLSLSSMLSMEEIRQIASKLSDMTGYKISCEHAPSRVVLLCKDKQAEESRIIRWVDGQEGQQDSRHNI